MGYKAVQPLLESVLPRPDDPLERRMRRRMRRLLGGHWVLESTGRGGVQVDVRNLRHPPPTWRFAAAARSLLTTLHIALRLRI